MRRLTTNTKFITENHSEKCVDILKKISRKFAIRDIHGSKYRYGFYSFNKVELKFSEGFCRSIDELNANEIISAECEYIKKTPEYALFLSSSLFTEIKSELERFFSRDETRKKGSWGGTYEPSNITGCWLSSPIRSSWDSQDNYFSFRLNTDYHESDYGYEPILFVEKKYRALTMKETSMLSVALSESFPERFCPSWNFGVYPINKVLYMDPFLAPIYLAQPKPRWYAPKPKDIY